jgi:hypothetical protein
MPTNLPRILGQLAIAFCFLSFGIWELVAPNLWTMYVPSLISAMIDAKLLVFVHGIVLTIIGLGILSGFYRWLFLGLSVLVMLEICLSLILDEGFTETLIRDGAILLFILGHFVDSWQNRPVVMK